MGFWFIKEYDKKAFTTHYFYFLSLFPENSVSTTRCHRKSLTSKVTPQHHIWLPKHLPLNYSKYARNY